MGFAKYDSSQIIWVNVSASDITLQVYGLTPKNNLYLYPSVVTVGPGIVGGEREIEEKTKGKRNLRNTILRKSSGSTFQPAILPCKFTDLHLRTTFIFTPKNKK